MGVAAARAARLPSPHSVWHRLMRTARLSRALLLRTAAPSPRPSARGVDAGRPAVRECAPFRHPPFRRALVATAIMGTPAEAAAPPAAPPCPRLAALRAAMAAADGGDGVDAYLVPTEDPHMVRESGEGGLWGGKRLRHARTQPSSRCPAV